MNSSAPRNPSGAVMAAELGQQTVDFSVLVRRVTEDAYLSLKELVDKSSSSAEERPDLEKKMDLLKFIDKTRQRMLRLLVVAKWCHQKNGKLNVEDHSGDEVLQVRAYGGSYITLGINIRNGHFLIQSSANILAQSALLDCEEALNKGRISATEVFFSLRRKSILHLFASSGRFLGLKVFEECSATLKIPNSILHGNDLLLMGFPQCGGSYYMLMQLDKDFKPVLNLLEAQPDPDGKPQSISDRNVIRFKEINIGRMQMIEDELNLRLLDCEKLHSSSNIGACSQISLDDSKHDDVYKHERTAVKHTVSHMQMIPSFQRSTTNSRLSKRRKKSESAHSNLSEALSSLSCIAGGYMHGDQPVEVTNDLPPSNINVSVLYLIRHCSLCIKHAQLTSQMDALDISYVEEQGLRAPFSNLCFGLPFPRDDSWQNIYLHLGKPGSMSWDVRIKDPHFKELWELQKGSTSTPWGSGVRIANASDSDSHINYDPYGVILSYTSVEVDSIQRLISDLQRLSSARIFACGMRKLIDVKSDNKLADANTNSDIKLQYPTKGSNDASDKLSEQMRRNFKIEAVGLMSLWFCYDSMPVMAHFVVEWEVGKEGCTMHVSPDHLWPHTKFLEDFINGAEVGPFLDCIRLTAGPLLALAAAIHSARTPGPVSTGPITVAKQNTSIPSQGQLPNALSPSTTITTTSLVSHSLRSATMLSFAGRGGSGIFPSSLLPIDVSVVLRGPYWIRIIYRKKFAIDMRCFAGDEVWLQPATPPKGGPAAEGSLPCPQFRPLLMEHVARALNALEPNTAFIGLGDDGGYGGGWVPLAALKKVLRGILKYLGVLWLFAQLPDLLTEILGSLLKENEGALLNLDQEQPALRFFVGGYVFTVSVHRVQLLLQLLIVKRFHHLQPPQQTLTNAQEELAPGEINEICDYFSRHVASEPYDVSRVASFITLLTLPISVIREFLKLISWKKVLSQAHGGEIASVQRARVELCLENHSGSVSDEYLEGSTTSKSNIHHDRALSSVNFALTFVLDPAHIPHINSAGGAAWLSYCAYVMLRYSFGESTRLTFLGMDGSHGGRACWLQLEDWEKCKQRMVRTVEYVNGLTVGDVTQGRLRFAAEALQRTLQVSFQHSRDGAEALQRTLQVSFQHLRDGVLPWSSTGA